MGRTRSPDIIKRNDAIYSAWLRGASLTSLGERYSLSRQVVGRIVAAQHPEEAEDDDRALLRGYMWRLYDEVQEIGESPGWKMSPQGGCAFGPDGEPAVDTQVQVQAKDLQLKIIRELRILDGRDKQHRRETPQDLAMQQMWSSIAAEKANAEAARLSAAERDELEELRRQRAQAIPGEVVRELPPAAEG